MIYNIQLADFKFIKNIFQITRWHSTNIFIYLLLKVSSFSVDTLLEVSGFNYFDITRSVLVQHKIREALKVERSQKLSVNILLSFQLT